MGEKESQTMLGGQGSARFCNTMTESPRRRGPARASRGSTVPWTRGMGIEEKQSPACGLDVQRKRWEQRDLFLAEQVGGCEMGSGRRSLQWPDSMLYT